MGAPPEIAPIMTIQGPSARAFREIVVERHVLITRGAVKLLKMWTITLGLPASDERAPRIVHPSALAGRLQSYKLPRIRE
jgi:hypothetical protein